MADVFSTKKRSWIMGRVRGRDTKPELLVRRWLHGRGLRFRLHRADLPGKPDIVLPRHRTVVFVHGCFWHSHPGCKRAALPAANREYWEAKIARNVRRDRRNARALRAAGWSVITLWECKIRRAGYLERRFAALSGDDGG